MRVTRKVNNETPALTGCPDPKQMYLWPRFRFSQILLKRVHIKQPYMHVHVHYNHFACCIQTTERTANKTNVTSDQSKRRYEKLTSLHVHPMKSSYPIESWGLQGHACLYLCGNRKTGDQSIFFYPLAEGAILTWTLRAHLVSTLNGCVTIFLSWCINLYQQHPFSYKNTKALVLYIFFYRKARIGLGVIIALCFGSIGVTAYLALYYGAPVGVHP